MNTKIKYTVIIFSS